MTSQPEPFLLKPIGKDYLWGGSRLNDDFGIPLPPLAEAWVCSTHHDGASQVLSTGEDLREVLNSHSEWLSTHSLAITNWNFQS